MIDAYYLTSLLSRWTGRVTYVNNIPGKEGDLIREFGIDKLVHNVNREVLMKFIKYTKMENAPHTVASLDVLAGTVEQVQKIIDAAYAAGYKDGRGSEQIGSAT